MPLIANISDLSTAAEVGQDLPYKCGQGFEIEPNRYVVIDPADLEAINLTWRAVCQLGSLSNRAAIGAHHGRAESGFAAGEQLGLSSDFAVTMDNLEIFRPAHSARSRSARSLATRWSNRQYILVPPES